ncbi:MAG TPA: nucleotide disphospho-sugar-binding domain-containing protein [Intrasporangium sp.]|nr:nucleotide disphospho-sugar-binding domain-containing protein [Intrasporangium sp.]
MADVLVCASSLTGHVTPMLTVAGHLREAGHAVRMITGSRFAEQVAAVGVKFVPLRGAADIDDRDLDRAFPGRARTRGIARARFDVSCLFVDSMRPQWAVLSEELQHRSADVVVHDATFLGVAPLLARGAPRPAVVGCGVIPLALSSPRVPPFGTGLPYAVGASSVFRNVVVGAAIRRVVLGRQQREAQAALAQCLPGARFSGHFMDSMVVTDCFLQLSVSSLDYPRPDLPPTISYVGPVLPRGHGAGQLPDWWSRLDGSRPVVLVTQGTLDVSDLQRLIGPTVDGLRDENVLVVAVTGGPPTDRLGPLPANTVAATFVPFDLLMRHVSVMVTNGGFGGMHQALAHDVPLVIAGDTEEKPETAARVEWAGVGVNLRTGTPTAAQVREAVRRMLGPGPHRVRAQSIGAEIRRTDALGRIAAEVEARTAGQAL